MEARVIDWSDSFWGFVGEEPEYDLPEQEENEGDSDYDLRLTRGMDWEDLREIIEPEPGNFKTPAERIRDYRNKYEPEAPHLPQGARDSLGFNREMEMDDLREATGFGPGNVGTPAERPQDHREFYEPEAPQLPQEPRIDLRKDHGRLQIIVKLANIHLNPENPHYPGGSWHVEGQANESM